MTDAKEKMDKNIDQLNEGVSDLKKKVVEILNDGKEALKEAVADAKDAASVANDKLKRATDAAMEQAKHAAREVGDVTKHAAHDVMDAAQHAAHDVGDAAKHAKHNAEAAIKRAATRNTRTSPRRRSCSPSCTPGASSVARDTRFPAACTALVFPLLTRSPSTLICASGVKARNGRCGSVMAMRKPR